MNESIARYEPLKSDSLGRFDGEVLQRCYHSRAIRGIAFGSHEETADYHSRLSGIDNAGLPLDHILPLADS